MSAKKKRLPLPLLSQGVQLVDSHCHLDMAAYAEDCLEVISRSRQAGVETIFSIGIDLESSKTAAELATRHENIYATVGIHPHHAEEAGAAVYDALTELTASPKVIGIGEIGLDLFKDYAPVAIQTKVFKEQLELAKSLKLPVIIHDRDAHDTIIDILIESGPHPAGGVIHCFSGDKNVARRFLDLDFHLSIPGVVTFKKATELQEAAAFIPLDRMLVETDGPFLAPEPWRGKRNEPAYTLYTAEKIAQLKGISLDDVARQTTKNIALLFNINI
ncbi:MAG: TatD family hydrolase [Proteobacteria bacterium]|nr:TatD family hydrolase [Pseudomonadota bacterium]MBU1640523.1 TatD family hydrolase [Pseudomonadota bacterium]